MVNLCLKSNTFRLYFIPFSHVWIRIRINTKILNRDLIRIHRTKYLLLHLTQISSPITLALVLLFSWCGARSCCSQICHLFAISPPPPSHIATIMDGPVIRQYSSRLTRFGIFGALVYNLEFFISK